MRRRRDPLPPSSSHRLAVMASTAITRLSFCRNETALAVRKELLARRDEVARLAGPDLAPWAIDQLSTPPHFTKGWPSPCKAGRMRLRKANQQ